MKLLQELEAAQTAEGVIRDLGIEALPIDPFAIAARHDITVEPKPAEPGVSGILVRVGERFAICYATHIDNGAFIRFSVAHELGHFFLTGHPEHFFANGVHVHQSRGGFVSADPYELQADHFAANLLMPDALFDAALQESGQGLAAIEVLASRCETSLTSTAIKFATRTPDPAAVIVSRGDKIDYCFLSEVLRDLKGLRWPRKGSLVPHASPTGRFNCDKTNIEGGRREEAITELDLWLDGAPEIQVNEDVVGLGKYGRTLTVLHTDEAIESPEDDDV